MEKSRVVKKGFLGKGWVVKFQSRTCRKLYTFKIKPMHLVLMGVLIFFIIGKVHEYQAYREKMRQEDLARLQQVTREQSKAIMMLRTEKKAVSHLLEKQTQEMAARLENIEKRDNEIRKMVGLKPKEIKNVRRTLRGSRGGMNLIRLRTSYRLISQAISAKEEELDSLRESVIAYNKEIERKRIQMALDATPTLWPVHGYISSDYGWRAHPLGGYSQFHSGVDIVSDYGTPIYAAGAGVVSFSGYYGGYGYSVIVDHENGFCSLYAHCSQLAVRHGERVKKGQIIAYVGSTGGATGPHLHYEVSVNGETTDPRRYLSIPLERLADLRMGRSSL